MHTLFYTTVYENGNLRQTEETVSFEADTEEREKAIVNLYPEVAYQTFCGFGGAVTESAAYVYRQMPQDVREEILRAYFAEDGLRYSLIRTPIDSCDFSLGHYAAMEDAADTALSSFSLARAEQYVLPMIYDINRTAKTVLPTMLTPWSPPSFMKTNHNRNKGGSLKREYYALWAEYICKYIIEYQKRGLNITLLSVQNEPKAVQTWDSCIFTAEQEKVFIRDYLSPKLKESGLDGIQLLIWDHNKERAYERAAAVMDSAEMQKLVAGVAVHWYSGDHFESLAMLKARFPDKRIVFSEACIEYQVVKDQSPLNNAQQYGHDIIGDFNHGLDTFLDWNLVLDQQGGPNHAENYCDAPIICHTENGTWRKNLSYHYIGHFSKYIQLGAKRIAFSRYTNKLEMTAFLNPDQSITAVMMNTGSEDLPIYLRLHNQLCPLVIQAKSISTCVIR